VADINALQRELIMLKSCSVVLALGALLSASPSHALTIDFSFTDTVGNVSGTVTGEIEGLKNNAYSQATDIIIESAPAALGLVTPFDVLSFNTGLTLVDANDFYVTNGNITAGTLVFSTNYGSPPYYPLNWQFCMAISQPGYCGAPTGAYLLNGNGLEVATDASPNFTGPTMDATSPLPAAFPLFATGLGAIVLLGWRRKRANTSAFAA
jgi:hypothetical protein